MTTTLNFDELYFEIVAQAQAEKRARLAPPLVRFWDGNWNLRGNVTQIISASVTDIDNETGIASFDLPEDYYISQWIMDVDARTTSNIHVTIDKDGVRWSGRMAEFKVIKNANGVGTVRITFKHDYEELKSILCWANPFLPAELQFPRVWCLFGPAAWALKCTLAANLLRLNKSLWMLPSDPLDPNGGWGSTQSNWQVVVAPGSISKDNSLPAIVTSRFKNMHEVSAEIVADAQLSWTFRRYLDGDEQPWPNANLRHGALVIDLVDKSGFTTGTSHGGSLFSGLIKSLINIDSDGLGEGVTIINDPNSPAEYENPNFIGTLPEAPWVIYRDGENTGIQQSEFTSRPATTPQIVGGGHSMPGVNELISSAIQLAGDAMGAVPFLPPIGGVLDAVLKPLYTDTVLAFAAWKSQSRAQELGWSHYYEHWAQGADRAYTLSWLIAMRSGLWETRATTSHTVTVADGAPYRIGERGHGHFYKGDRVGTTVRGMPKGRVFVDRVSQVNLEWSRDTVPVWGITIGQREVQDPAVKAFQALQKLISTAQELGVL